jgi:hypothetical protein
MNRMHSAAVPQPKTVRMFLTWINRIYRINPMHREVGPLAWVGSILSILFIHVKTLGAIR